MKNLGKFVTVLNLHIAVVAILLLANAVLVVKVFLAWHAIHSDQSPAFAAQQIHYGELQAQMGHIHGLPQKVQKSRHDADQFTADRIAPNYSTIAAEIGTLTTKENVRWTRATYTQTPAGDGLTNVRIDASLSGEYAPLMHFINDLERDKNHVFFIITGVALNGQQGGLVNLRLRVDTFIRAGATDVPVSTGPADNSTAQLQTPQLEEAR
jgi:type IV pilus assembly protein PilO